MPTDSEIHMIEKHAQKISRASELYRCCTCGETIQIRSKYAHVKSKFHLNKLKEQSLDIKISR